MVSEENFMDVRARHALGKGMVIGRLAGEAELESRRADIDPETKRLITLIQLGREERFLDYKQSFPWHDLRHIIAKTALGMANIRDGGTILIGVSQTKGRFVPEGMPDEHIATYKADDIQAYINRFADPYVRTKLYPIEWNSKKFLAMIVDEFDEIPVVCKKDSQEGKNHIREGAIYTRSYRIPETCEVRSQTEMREIIEMATEKRLRAFIKMSSRAGIPLSIPTTHTAEQVFEEQLRGVF
jgi:hypothetical protein